MTSTPAGLYSLSASQAEEFDPAQFGGCPRRWYFHRVMGLAVPGSGAAQEDGNAGHAHFAEWYRTGKQPGRARMGKAVNGAIDAGHLPPRGPDQLIESRFDGQSAKDEHGDQLPLRVDTTLWLGGVPWDGYVDLRFYRAAMITVLDHKFSSDIHAYAKTDLLATVQMPVYALDSLRLWPEAKHIELVHHYVSRRGMESFVRRQLITVGQVRQRGEQIANLARQMQKAARAPSAEDVPGNRASCHTWSGCPFQSRCSVFKEKPKMNLSDEELSWLGVLGSGAPEAKPGSEEDGEPPDLRAQRAEDASRHATNLEIASAPVVNVFDSVSDDPFAVFAPKASVPAEQPAKPASCGDCGTELNSENGSQRDGVWKHLRCPAATVVEVAGFAPAAIAGTSGPGAVGILVQDGTGVAVAKCPDCPHPAHAGAACTGKRGRGVCRCGVAKGTAGNAEREARAVMERDGTGSPQTLAPGFAEGGSPVNEADAFYQRLQDAPEASSEMTADPGQGSDKQLVEVAPGVLVAAEEARRWEREADALRGEDARFVMIGGAPAPGETLIIPMLLWCPACHARHVDTGEFAEKPHHTHACQACGLAWRPAVVNTAGVQFLPGFRND